MAPAERRRRASSESGGNGWEIFLARAPEEFGRGYSNERVVKFDFQVMKAHMVVSNKVFKYS